uniref:ribosome silencing factor n=1 Tax=Vaginimicrobium propionicum TaxID=1871034 RepID=UPI00097044FD|nr:ribosome silencing factor [Vaginimicrobium propionicum]
MAATQEAIDTAKIAAEAAASKLASDIVAFDVSEKLAVADIFLIVSGHNEPQVDAIMDEVQDKILAQIQQRPIRREGDRQLRWVLLDYGDVVVHIQHESERVLYSLERLWKDCPQIDLGLVDADGNS